MNSEFRERKKFFCVIFFLDCLCLDVLKRERGFIGFNSSIT